MEAAAQGQPRPEPGPRQTVDRVTFPNAGTGRLVWKHGPAFFLPDNEQDSVIHLHKVDYGGARSEPPQTWRRVWPTEGSIAVDAIVEEGGEQHSRWFSPLFGDGWLVTEGRPQSTREVDTKEGRGFVYMERFEDMDGNVKVRFEVREICVGRPAYREKMKRKSSKMPQIDDPDEMNWTTYRTVDGTIMAFRRGGPPPPAGTFIPMKPHDYATLSPKAKKAYDLAKAAQSTEPMAPSSQLTLDTGSER